MVHLNTLSHKAKDYSFTLLAKLSMQEPDNWLQARYHVMNYRLPEYY